MTANMDVLKYAKTGQNKLPLLTTIQHINVLLTIDY